MASIEGCLIMKFRFIPTFNKWCGKRCNGFFLHISNAHEFRPYRTSLLFLKVILEMYKDKFLWKEPPYEYVFDKRPIDLIIGDTRVVHWIEEGAEIQELESSWENDLKEYLKFRERFLLY